MESAPRFHVVLGRIGYPGPYSASLVEREGVISLQTLTEIWVPVASLQDASDVLVAFTRAEDMGASEMTYNFGRIQHGWDTVARVSYNGRVWENDGNTEILGERLTAPL